MQRIGLFGGTFDPVHLGHLLVAQAAFEELQLSRLFFIPASQSPFKPESSPAPAAARLRLLRLALAGQTQYEVDDQEIRRGGTSFTIDTVRDYAARYSGAELFYLIGADQVGQLDKWREAEELARLVQFAVIPRSGAAAVAERPPFRLRGLQGFPVGISSSQIRERVRGGLSIQPLVPAAVAEAIRNMKLYL